MIQKIYEVDPLICPQCQGAMRIISGIEDPSVTRGITFFRSVMLSLDNFSPLTLYGITLTP